MTDLSTDWLLTDLKFKVFLLILNSLATGNSKYEALTMVLILDNAFMLAHHFHFHLEIWQSYLQFQCSNNHKGIHFQGINSWTYWEPVWRVCCHLLCDQWSGLQSIMMGNGSKFREEGNIFVLIFKLWQWLKTVAASPEPCAYLWLKKAFYTTLSAQSWTSSFDLSVRIYSESIQKHQLPITSPSWGRTVYW